MDSQTDHSLPEDSPLSFEDLPDQAIGIILGKLVNLQDKMHLSRASPTARRLTKGSDAEPGIFGSLSLDLETTAEEGAPVRRSAVRYFKGPTTCNVVLRSYHPDFPLALAYLAARSKAFSDIQLTCNLAAAIDAGAMNAYCRVLEALYSQGVCAPVRLVASNSDHASGPSLAPLEALLSHWLAVSEGIHSPRDRSLQLSHLYGHIEGAGAASEGGEDRFAAFFRALQGLGRLHAEQVYPRTNAFPEMPRLAGHLEALHFTNSTAYLSSGSLHGFTALREVTLDVGVEHATPGALHELFASCAPTLESVDLTIGVIFDHSEASTLALVLEPFTRMPRLRRLRFSPVHRHYVHLPLPSEDDGPPRLLLPSLEELDLRCTLHPNVTPAMLSRFLSTILAPNLTTFSAQWKFPSPCAVYDFSCAFLGFPALESARLLLLARNEGEGGTAAVPFHLRLGDLTEMRRLGRLEVMGALGSKPGDAVPAVVEVRAPPQLGEVRRTHAGVQFAREGTAV